MASTDQEGAGRPQHKALCCSPGAETGDTGATGAQARQRKTHCSGLPGEVSPQGGGFGEQGHTTADGRGRGEPEGVWSERRLPWDVAGGEGQSSPAVPRLVLWQMGAGFPWGSQRRQAPRGFGAGRKPHITAFFLFREKLDNLLKSTCSIQQQKGI